MEQGKNTNMGVSERNTVPQPDPSQAMSSLLPGPAWRAREREPWDPRVEGSAEAAVRGC